MFVRYLLKGLMLPPAINILLILAVLVLPQRWRWFKYTVIALSLISLTVLSMPITSEYLARQLEHYPPIESKDIQVPDYQAIVVLGGGRHANALEYGGDTLSSFTLQRVRYAAHLQRETGLPILVTGGIVHKDIVSEAELMAQVLEQEFFASVQWRESGSRNTWENARLSKKIADQSEIKNIMLVTHAWHMPRAVYSFKQAGFENIIAAPTMFRSIRVKDPVILDFVPGAKALRYSSLMLHEMLGLQWYRWMN